MRARFTALTKRVTAIAGAVALTTAALLAGAGAAAADPISPGNIDFDAHGSITVHKHEQPNPQGEVGDGSLQNVDSAPIEGVEFTVEQLDIDLRDPEVWERLNDIDPANPGPRLSGTRAGQTKPDGTVTFENLPVGVYLVTETNGPSNVVTKAAPFIVVVPMPVKGNWTYDIHAYPKNPVSTLDKTLDETADQAALGQGDEVVWNVKSTAPALANNDTLRKYEINDLLDGRLGYVNVTDVQYDGTALDPTDYTVTAPAAYQTGEITVALTEQGLNKVKANSGKDLTFKLVTVVIDDIDDGAIPNNATQITNINDQETKIESNEDITYWGYVNVLKQDKANAKKLAGAEFQVFPTEADAKAGTKAITINGETTFTTAADGTLKIGALNVGADGTQRDYWIKETKAPTGYVLDETVHKVTVKPGQNADVVYTIDNVKHDVPDLPLTGATGTALFAVIANLRS